MLGGNVARESLRLLVQKQANKNPVVKESLTKKLDEMRGELSGQTPSPLEKLLVERVLATWLHLHYLEGQYACRDSMALTLASYYERSISSAQKRYLAAIKGLAEVRKLALPVLQINVAKKQLNVAAGTVAGISSN